MENKFKKEVFLVVRGNEDVCHAYKVDSLKQGIDSAKAEIDEILADNEWQDTQYHVTVYKLKTSEDFEDRDFDPGYSKMEDISY